jgi:hypothetical protein
VAVVAAVVPVADAVIGVAPFGYWLGKPWDNAGGPEMQTARMAIEDRLII